MRTHLPRAAAKQQGQVSSGFTLFESVIAIVIISILAVALLPKINNPADLTLIAQARNLASTVQRAQSMAMTSGAAIKLTANPHSYSVQYAPSGTVIMSVTLENNVTFDTSTGLLSAVTFDNLGKPDISTAGSFVLTSNGTATATVSVQPLTGLSSAP